ncbi:response regulator transcription factor [Companilactobacillus nodensis]|uniref:LuxR family two-component response regulator n=1 Tax=Companilactobacillus nodensis DSM 19682 = JCM 14932 = NBRC 107160 TaxID=1423775 RepID=A0A0R1KAU8_9LACO|nr:response regulator transcription factor [Companilactobacillus nodensis]KRK80588.1 LuxR family two-component response regulator [Companilactobacillus nodensis DSM 19682 = JCM 14932 = NBRC 107160]
MTTIYLAEDQEMLNTALATLLGLEDDLNVIGTATDGQTALSEIIQKKPQIAILDIEMPKLSGLDVAEQINLLNIPTKVIILTTFARAIYFEQAVKANVNGYLLKDNPTDQLVKTIHEVLDGQTIFSPELVTTIISAEKNPLTKRELEVLKEIKTGKNSKEIAKSVFLSDGTVRNYISSILSKTGTSSRIEALNIAEKNKWI